jgi:hypothetical protein
LHIWKFPESAAPGRWKNDNNPVPKDKRTKPRTPTVANDDAIPSETAITDL